MSAEKSDPPSVDQRDPQYFGYYAQLQHQQNMLQDTVRTSTYRSAILLNGPNCFKDKLIMDVGAGSGVLSYFAAQAGASKVYAVEASDMARKMKKLVEASSEPLSKNGFMKGKIEVINAKIEQPDLPIPKVDTIVSEPIGVLLFHERMLESFIHARDTYLKPGGALFPSKDAKDEMFGMPVVGHFDPQSLLSAPSAFDGYDVDFSTVSVKELQDLTIPFRWVSNYTGIMHGVAGWFDLLFAPPPYTTSNTQQNVNVPSTVLEMSTGPAAERTHWQQVRFLFKEPLAVNANQVVRGWMRCIVNDMRSYTIYVEAVVGDEGSLVELSDPSTIVTNRKFVEDSVHSHPLRRRAMWELQEQTYNYSYNPGMVQQETKLEYMCLYEPEGNMVIDMEGTTPLPDASNSNFINFVN
ncbi:S-adenosyl-L-methionine-dependent methyltransferase [Umbelopsis sp. PMI_123]|nr:S-adenosyl-L-methionine-dependent methyltransferase [Umbelopsis sp. PMI_123]